MILFVFEGQRREPEIYRTIQRIFFTKENEDIIYSFGNNLYKLYKELQEYDGDGDLVSLLKENLEGKSDNPFQSNTCSSDFSEIYLFFDYDFHNKNLSLKELNREVKEMLSLFCDENDKGKLYINYPMVESIRYTKELPDQGFHKYSVSRDDCCNFKKLAAQFSHYKSLNFIQFDKRQQPTEEKLAQLRQNWQHLQKQNVWKANYLCNNEVCFPATKEEISQQRIFESQLEKYVLAKSSSVAILNAFPLFLYDYFK